MFPRQRLPPSESLVISRLLRPIRRPAFLNFDQDTSQIRQALSPPVDAEKPCIPIVEWMLDTFDPARAGLWAAYDDDVGKDIA